MDFSFLVQSSVPFDVGFPPLLLYPQVLFSRFPFCSIRHRNL
jgi:hypothetical protein